MANLSTLTHLVRFMIDELDELQNDDDRIDTAIDGLIDAEQALKDLAAVRLSGVVYRPPTTGRQICADCWREIDPNEAHECKEQRAMNRKYQRRAK